MWQQKTWENRKYVIIEDMWRQKTRENRKYVTTEDMWQQKTCDNRRHVTTRLTNTYFPLTLSLYILLLGEYAYIHIYFTKHVYLTWFYLLLRYENYFMLSFNNSYKVKLITDSALVLSGFYWPLAIVLLDTYMTSVREWPGSSLVWSCFPPTPSLPFAFLIWKIHKKQLYWTSYLMES